MNEIEQFNKDFPELKEHVHWSKNFHGEGLIPVRFVRDSCIDKNKFKKSVLLNYSAAIAILGVAYLFFLIGLFYANYNVYQTLDHIHINNMNIDLNETELAKAMFNFLDEKDLLTMTEAKEYAKNKIENRPMVLIE